MYQPTQHTAFCMSRSTTYILPGLSTQLRVLSANEVIASYKPGDDVKLGLDAAQLRAEAAGASRWL